MTNGAATWLKSWAFANAAVGLLVALSAFTPLAWPTTLFLDLVYWPLDGHPQLASAEGRLLAVIGGGITAGWCVLTGLLVDHAGRTGDAGPLRLVLISLVVWFVIDTSGSFVVGAWMNAVVNVIILAGFVVPMLAGGVGRGARVAGAERH